MNPRPSPILCGMCACSVVYAFTYTHTHTKQVLKCFTHESNVRAVCGNEIAKIPGRIRQPGYAGLKFAQNFSFSFVINLEI